MATELARDSSADPAEAVARVAESKRRVLLNVCRGRLREQDLEDCYGQAVLELVVYARGHEFESDLHIARTLELRFRARIADRRRMVGGKSPIEAALAEAVEIDDAAVERSVNEDEVDEAVVCNHDLRRLREVADDLSADQRLVLACQISLDMQSPEFCERFGWSVEKFRKTAQRARARLRVLTGEYERGERCQRLEADLLAYVARVADDELAERVRRHLGNCPACARTARELEIAQRGVAALLPIPLIAKVGLLAKLGGVGVGLRKLLPFLENDVAGGAAVGGTGGAVAVGAGGAGVAAGGSVAGVGAAKLAVVALCAGGAVGGYTVCERVGLLGPVPGETRSAKSTSHERRADVSRSRAPITKPIAIATTPRRDQPRRMPKRSPSMTRNAQVEREFGPQPGSRRSASAASSAREFDAGARSASVAPRPAQPPAREFVPAGSGSAGEFGFE